MKLFHRLRHSEEIGWNKYWDSTSETVGDF